MTAKEDYKVSIVCHFLPVLLSTPGGLREGIANDISFPVFSV